MSYGGPTRWLIKTMSYGGPTRWLAGFGLAGIALAVGFGEEFLPYAN